MQGKAVVSVESITNTSTCKNCDEPIFHKTITDSKLGEFSYWHHTDDTVVCNYDRDLNIIERAEPNE